MNAHLHPAFAAILNTFAALPQQVQAANDSALRPVKRQVTVRYPAGCGTAVTQYEGIYPTAADAVNDATARFGVDAVVSVKRL